MTLDFLENVNEFGESVVRLYNSNMAEAIAFKAALDFIVIQEKKAFNVSKLSFVESRNCELSLHINDEDIGIQTLDNHKFFCCMTLDGFKAISEMLVPYTERETKGYKILYDVDTPIDFLFAPGGTW